MEFLCRSHVPVSERGHRGETTTALWGARNVHQLDSVEEAFGWKLSGDDYAKVDKILREIIKNPIGPEFMAPGAR